MSAIIEQLNAELKTRWDEAVAYAKAINDRIDDGQVLSYVVNDGVELVIRAKLEITNDAIKAIPPKGMTIIICSKENTLARYIRLTPSQAFQGFRFFRPQS